MFIHHFSHIIRHAAKGALLLFILLFIVQLVFFVLIAFVNVKYQLALTQDIRRIIVPLQQANYDENAIKTGVPFVQGAAGLYESYQSALGNITKLVSYQLLAFLFVFLFGFALTHRLFGKKNVAVVWVHLAARALLFLVPFFFVAYYMINQALSTAAAENTVSAQWLVYSLFGITLLTAYFMLVCLALPVQSLFRALRRCFSLGVFRAHYILPVLFLNSIILFGLGWLLSVAVQNWALWIVALLLVLFIFGFVVARVVFFSAVRAVFASPRSFFWKGS